MFICLCHAVTDHEITAAVDNGLNDVGALMNELKVATQCGSCLNEVIEILNTHQGRPTSGHIGTPHIYGTKKSASLLCMAEKIVP